MQGDIYISDICHLWFLSILCLSSLFCTWTYIISLSICSALLAVKLHSLVHFLSLSLRAVVISEGDGGVTSKRVYERDRRGANGVSDGRLRKPFHGDAKDKHRSCGNITETTPTWCQNTNRDKYDGLLLSSCQGAGPVCEVVTAGEEIEGIG